MDRKTWGYLNVPPLKRGEKYLNLDISIEEEKKNHGVAEFTFERERKK